MRSYEYFMRVWWLMALWRLFWRSVAVIVIPLHLLFSSFQLSRNPRLDQLHFILFNFLPVLFREVSKLHTMEMLMRARSWSDHDPQKKNFSLSVFMLGKLSIHIFIIWRDAVEMPYSKTKQGQKDNVIMLMLQERRCLQLFWR